MFCNEWYHLSWVGVCHSDFSLLHSVSLFVSSLLAFSFSLPLSLFYSSLFYSLPLSLPSSLSSLIIHSVFLLRCLLPCSFTPSFIHFFLLSFDHWLLYFLPFSSQTVHREQNWVRLSRLTVSWFRDERSQQFEFHDGLSSLWLCHPYHFACGPATLLFCPVV